MDADFRRSTQPEGETTFAILGAAMEVLNALGPGLLEKPYENALLVELRSRGLRVAPQQAFPVVYKGVEVGTYVPDLIVEDRVVVETKVIDGISNHERGQVLNYLRVTGLQVGLILNFKRAKLEWERIVL